MVVVAVIGILAAIAIPNYQRYQARSRQSEAKVALSSSYTAEQGFFAEQGTFTLCLKRMGVEGDRIGKRYYAFGFYASSWSSGFEGVTCGPTGTSYCGYYTYSGNSPQMECNDPSTAASGQGETFFDSTASGNSHAPVGILMSTTCCMATVDTMTQNTFFLPAFGNISKDNITDIWTINQNKTLVNSQPGI